MKFRSSQVCPKKWKGWKRTNRAKKKT